MKKLAKYGADVLVMLTIFFIILLYIFDYIISIKFNLPYSPRWGSHHFHCIKDCLIEVILWYVCFWKCFRLGACKYTWIALISYGILILSWISYYIFLFPYEIMQWIEIVTLLFGMFSMLLTYTIKRWTGSR